MSRTLPGVCPHGYVFDWGDFACDCAAPGECSDPDEHDPVEWCPQGCNDGVRRGEV